MGGEIMATFKRAASQALIVIAVLLTSTAALLVATPAHANNSDTIKKLAIAPFISISSSARKTQALSDTLDCALSGLCYRDQEALPPTEQNLVNLLRQGVAEYYGDALIPQPEVTQHFLTMAKTDKETPREIAIRLGQDLDVDHVLIGILWRYQQRVGGPLTAEKPASVAFNLFLLNVTNKQLVWQGSFDKTQEALSDNLFEAALFFKSGVKWLTAEELAEFGIKRTLKSLK